MRKYKRYLNIDKKLCLSYNGLRIQNEIYEILKDDELSKEGNKKIINPFFELIANFNGIDSILKLEEPLEYIYLNRYKIHKILYDDDNSINIDEKILTKFTDYYYLYYLIWCQDVVVNYKYNFKLVKNAYDMQIIAKKDIKKIILAKIAITIIDNYCSNGDNNDVDILDECEKYKTLCIEKINENKNVLEKYKIDLDLDNLEKSEVSLEDIYSDIISTLIIKKELNESGETLNILNELEIKKIRLNKTIFDSLLKALTEKNLKEYIIDDFNDFFNEKIINFYSILFEYILKSTDYINFIPFLSEIQTKIKKLVKENMKELYTYFKRNKNKNSTDKLKKVLNYFVELEYYLNIGEEESKKILNDSVDSKNLDKPMNKNGDKLMSNERSSYHDSDNMISSSGLNSSSSYRFSSLLNGNNTNPNSYSNYEVSKKNKSELIKDKAYQILSDSTFIFNVKYNQSRKEADIGYKKIRYIDESNNYCELTRDELINIESDDEQLNGKYGEFLQFLGKVDDEIKFSYKRKKETEIHLTFLIQNYENFTMDCKYHINDKEVRETDFKDENILNEQSDLQGLNFMLEALNKN
jgi:hypothetical protein